MQTQVKLADLVSNLAEVLALNVGLPAAEAAVAETIGAAAQQVRVRANHQKAYCK